MGKYEAVSYVSTLQALVPYSRPFVPICVTVTAGNSSLLDCVTMSQTPSTSTSSSNFRSIFVTALKAYEKKTKTDLLIHPLATQLQPCNSSSDLLPVLHEK